MEARLKDYIDERRRLVERELKRAVVRREGAPGEIVEAMRYSLLAGGKRLRPVLVIAAAEVCGGRGKDVLPAACAVEMVHTYSLIHDDLPAMDDDDLRRGRPTSHKVFGEATAILAGDALLTFAFETAARSPSRRSAEAIAALARGAGYIGMVGGQVLDLEGDGRRRANGRLKASRRRSTAAAKRFLADIHARKTAALITASLETGAILAGASKAKVEALRAYGRAVGLAFQVADDVLDIVGDKSLLGKQGSDADNRKLTFPSLYGLEESRRIAARMKRRAQAALRPFGSKAWMLHSLADFIVERNA